MARLVPQLENPAMADVLIGEASHKALRARMASPEGREGMSKLVGLIVEAVLDVMPPDLLKTLDTPQGMEAFIAAWPDMVDAYLKAICKVPGGSAGKNPVKNRRKGGGANQR